MARLAFALLILLALAAPAQADSWMAPGPKLASSADGTTYVIVQPTKAWKDVRFQLVKRAEGRPARQPPYLVGRRTGEPDRIDAEKGDKVLARGAVDFVPLEVRCLNGGRGFVLFETYANVGYHTVFQRHDAKGKVVWSKSLRDLFSAKQIKGFSHSVSSIWWYEGLWIDEAAGDIVVGYKGEQGRGVLRVALKDGKQREGSAKGLLQFVGIGSAEERIRALDSAKKWKLDGVLEAVQAAFAKTSTPLLARLHFAVHMHAAGDESGTDLMRASAQAGTAPDARAHAVRHLSMFVPAQEALPLLRDAMRAKDDMVWSASEEALRKLGARAVETLTAMILDEKASERYRAGAATALWNMGAPAAPALPALKKVAKSGLPKLEYAAGHAIKHIAKEAAR